MRNAPATRLTLGIIGMVLLTASATGLEIMLDHKRHLQWFVFLIAVCWVGYLYALRVKYSTKSGA